MYKLNALTDSERNELITNLKAFPGHKVKLMSVFNVIKDVFLIVFLDVLDVSI